MLVLATIQYSQNLQQQKNKNSKIKWQMDAILPSSLNQFGHTTENATMQFLINQ